MNDETTIRPSLNLDNIPDDLKISAERYLEIRRFIEEYAYSPGFREGESAYEELSNNEKMIVSNWAIRIHARSLDLAPQITKLLINLVGDGVELLEYKTADGTILHKEKTHTIKSIDSIKRKIIADAILESDFDNTVNYDKAGAKIRDGIRYTIIIPDNIYLEKVDEILHKLEDMGFGPIDAKNHWVDHQEFWKVENKKNWPRLRYQGINAKIVCPNGQDVFEIQFHTPMEHQIKEGSTRDLYRVYRDKDIDLEWKMQLENYRMFLQSTIIPPDTKELKACDYRYESREKRR